MKRFIILVLAISITSIVMAQDKKISYGVQLGGNLSNMITRGSYWERLPQSRRDELKSDNKIGFQLGVFGQYDIFHGIFAGLGLDLITKGAKKTEQVPIHIEKYTNNLLYLQMPIVVGYSIP